MVCASQVYFRYSKYRILIVIALVCKALSASAFVSVDMVYPSDTLIIDGDTIFIEKEENALESDSTGLPDKTSLPRKLTRPPLRIWSVGIGLGLNTSLSRFESYNGNLFPLDGFIGNTPGPKVNWTGHLELGARFFSITVPDGKVELSLFSGVSWNMIRAGYSSLSDPMQLDTDSLLGFGTEEGELYYSYFTVTGSPDVGEVDTFFVDLDQSEMKLTTADIPLKLRVSLSRSSKPTRYYIESGVIRRLIVNRTFESAHYLFGDAGEWQKIEGDEFVFNRILTPHFALGVERKISTGQAMDQKFYTLGAQLNAAVPGIVINQGSQLAVDVGSFSVNAFARFFF